MSALRSPTAAFLRTLSIFEGLSHIFNEPVVSDVVIKNIHRELSLESSYILANFIVAQVSHAFLIGFVPAECSVNDVRVCLKLG